MFYWNKTIAIVKSHLQIYVTTEAVAVRCSVKKVFLEILKNSQENTGARVSEALAKNEALAQVFSCKFWEISKNTFSYRTPLVAAFVTSYVTSLCYMFRVR